MGLSTKTREHCPGRRRFLKIAGAAGAGMMGLGAAGCATNKPTASPPKETPIRSGPPDHVAIAALTKGAGNDDILAATRRTAEAATDFAWLSRGDTVFVKPVVNSPNPYPASTSPLAVKAMVELLREKGAGRVIVGDKPGVMTVYQDPEKHRGTSRDVFTSIGLQAAATEAGADVHYFDEAGYDAYSGFNTVTPGHWRGELMLPNILNQVDHVVLLPRVSRHMLSGTTLGLKAAVGWLRDDSRLEFHRDADSFFEKIAEINDATVLREKSRLTLSVATKVLATKGPDSGFVAEPDPGLIFASESLLAHDMVAASWLLWNREFTTPRDIVSVFSDPYIGSPSTLNRFFVGMMWGLDDWAEYKHYHAPPIVSAVSDPTILSAARFFGGMPRLELETVSGDLPDNIRKYIEAKTTV